MNWFYQRPRERQGSLAQQSNSSVPCLKASSPIVSVWGPHQFIWLLIISWTWEKTYFPAPGRKRLAQTQHLWLGPASVEGKLKHLILSPPQFIYLFLKSFLHLAISPVTISFQLILDASDRINHLFKTKTGNSISYYFLTQIYQAAIISGLYFFLKVKRRKF